MRSAKIPLWLAASIWLLQGETLFHFASVRGEPDQSVVLDRPGLVTISCGMHDEMHAYIVVDDAPSAVTSCQVRSRPC